MKVLRHLAQRPVRPAQDCVATIGNFDGLHRGHQQVLQQVQQQARAMGLPATVISFEPLPFEYFKPEQGIQRIYPLRDKVRRLRELGIERFACLSFNQYLATLSAEQFVHQVLLDNLQVRYLVVGDDFHFGYQRQGNFELLQRLGQAQDMQVVNTHTVQCQAQQRISSTRIRTCLQTGDLTSANQLLGSPYCLSGRVRHGNKLGRTLDFPTLNLRMPEHLALRQGVYAVQVHGLAATPLPGVGNLGSRPTVNGLQVRFEVHLFDFNQNVYGHHIGVEPRHFLRPEQRFDSLQALKQQISLDAEQARTWLSAHPAAQALS
ncbi:MAG: bifunctional riboflavin kinase/FAD synthetase [Thiolinea sp.]